MILKGSNSMNFISSQILGHRQEMQRKTSQEAIISKEIDRHIWNYVEVYIYIFINISSTM